MLSNGARAPSTIETWGKRGGGKERKLTNVGGGWNKGALQEKGRRPHCHYYHFLTTPAFSSLPLHAKEGVVKGSDGETTPGRMRSYHHY